MNAIEICKFVMENGVSQFRVKKDGFGYDVKPVHNGKSRGWILLDGFSASAVSKVYDALNEENQKKFAALPIQKALTVAFKFVK